MSQLTSPPLAVGKLAPPALPRWQSLGRKAQGLLLPATLLLIWETVVGAGLVSPRDRRHPEIARKESEILTLLNDGKVDFLDLSEELELAPRHHDPLLISRLNFAI